VADALLDAGADSVDVTDANAGTDREQPLFGEPGLEMAIGWGENRLSALFGEDVDIHAVLDAAGAQAGITLQRHRIARIEDLDWVRLTRSQFHPIRVSDRLWIVPSWCEPIDSNAINIVLDPGLAFGTGNHPTTRLCLRWLDERIEPGLTLIDYGCGSGVLAIAGAKLGAAGVVGVDIDPQALEVSRFNADRNAVTADFRAPDDNVPVAADLVVANILAAPLKALAPLLAGLTVHGGQLALSGILASQADEVADAYRQWFEIRIAASEEDWIRLEGIRR
jgi:ribosomal protein L11 methyltransferase